MTRIPIPVQNQHPCIACGHDNPAGLKMKFFAEGDLVSSSLKIPEHMCGWQGVAHGGVVSMVLDEIMGNAAIFLLRRIVLTRSIQVSFHRPLLLSKTIRAEAELAGQRDDRQVSMHARILDGQDGPCAEATGDFAVFTPAAARKVGLNEGLIKDFETHMQNIAEALGPTGDLQDIR